MKNCSGWMEVLICLNPVESCPSLTLNDGVVTYNSSAIDGGRYLPGTTATFQCNEGFDIFHPDSKICEFRNGKGRWSFSPPPFCTKSKV